MLIPDLIPGGLTLSDLKANAELSRVTAPQRLPTRQTQHSLLLRTKREVVSAKYAHRLRLPFKLLKLDTISTSKQILAFQPLIITSPSAHAPDTRNPRSQRRPTRPTGAIASMMRHQRCRRRPSRAMADTNTFTPNTLEDMIAMAGCDSVLEQSSAADAFGDDFDPTLMRRIPKRDIV